MGIYDSSERPDHPNPRNTTAESEAMRSTMHNESMDDLLSALRLIAMHKSWLPFNLRNRISVLGLHVHERRHGAPGGYWLTQLRAGGRLRSCLEAWREGEGDWVIKKFDTQTWERRFSILVKPTRDIAEFLSQRVHWVGDLDTEGKAILNSAVQQYRATGVWPRLPEVPEDVMDRSLEDRAMAEAQEEHRIRTRLISDNEKRVRKDPLDRIAWSSLSELYLKEGRNKDAENATKALLELDERKSGKANPFTYRQLAEIYLAALSVSVRGKGIRISGHIPLDAPAEALGYSIKELSELARENLVKADWAYTKEGRDLALKAASTLAVEAFGEFDKYKD